MGAYIEWTLWFQRRSFTSLTTTNNAYGLMIDDARLQLVSGPASLLALGTGLVRLHRCTR